MKNKKLKRLLYNSLDSPLPRKKKILLEEELKKDSGLAVEKENLLRLRAMIKATADSSLKPYFEERTLSRLLETEDVDGFSQFVDFLNIMFKRIVMPAIVLIILLAGYNIIQHGTIDIESALGITSYNLEDVNDPTILLTME